ncbi:MAG: esterase-like activity of phytase family protein [Bdellovibrio sp.]
MAIRLKLGVALLLFNSASAGAQSNSSTYRTGTNYYSTAASSTTSTAPAVNPQPALPVALPPTSLELCKADMEKICKDCQYDHICEAVDFAKESWTRYDLKQCIYNTLYSMDRLYFGIQRSIEIKKYPPPAPPAPIEEGKIKRVIKAADGTTSLAVIDDSKNGKDDKKDDKDKPKKDQYAYVPPRPFLFSDKIVDDCIKSINKSKSRENESQTAVRVVGESHIHSSTTYGGGRSNQLIGGLSGLSAYDRRNNEFYAISDDQRNATMLTIRWHENPQNGLQKPYGFSLSKKINLSVNYNKYSYKERIYNEDKNAAPRYRDVVYSNPIDLDREDIVILPNGNLLISSETDKSSDDKSIPSLFQEYTSDGKFVRGYPAPADFMASYKEEKVTYKCPEPLPPPRTDKKDDKKWYDDKYDNNKNTEPQKKDSVFISRSTAQETRKGTSLYDNYSIGGTVKNTSSQNSLPQPPTITPYQSVTTPTVSPSPLPPATPAPPKECFYMKKDLVGGLEFNKGIEAMTIVPNTDSILFANESPLIQDKKGGFFSTDYVRIYTTRLADWATISPSQYYKYPLTRDHDNGVPAILAIDHNVFIVLERGFNSFDQEAVVKLYKVDLRVTDKNGYLVKTLLVDFEDLKPQFAAGFKKIDNFEGMSLGPVNSKGEQVVFLVTDNNFNSNQRTTLLALSIPMKDLK